MGASQFKLIIISKIKVLQQQRSCHNLPKKMYMKKSRKTINLFFGIFYANVINMRVKLDSFNLQPGLESGTTCKASHIVSI